MTSKRGLNTAYRIFFRTEFDKDIRILYTLFIEIGENKRLFPNTLYIFLVFQSFLKVRPLFSRQNLPRKNIKIDRFNLGLMFLLFQTI